MDIKWFELDGGLATLIPIPVGHEVIATSVHRDALVFDPDTGNLVFDGNRENSVLRICIAKSRSNPTE